MPDLSRRHLLQAGALLFGGAAAAPVLAACSSSSSSKPAPAAAVSGGAASSAAPMVMAKVNYQLAWLNSVQFGGSYLAAENGYWKNLGLDVTLLPGGPNVPNDAETASGKALIDLSEADIVAHSVSQGADLKIIAHQYQKAPQTVLSLAKKPIKTPKDLEGAKLGIGASDQIGFKAFCTVAGIDFNKVKKIPTQYDPAVLVSGQVDAIYCFVNDLPVALAEKGIAGNSMLLADFGYTVATDTYTASAKALSDPTKRAQIVALMKGDIMGWQQYRKDPAAAAKLAVAKYPDAGLDLPTQLKVATVSEQLLFSDTTDKNGFGWFTDEDVADNVKLFKLLGVTGDATLWDRSILEEIYKNGPTI